MCDELNARRQAKRGSRNNNRGHPDKYAGHAKTVYIRKDAVLDAVSRFFADRV